MTATKNFFLNGQCYRIHKDLNLQEILEYFNYRNNLFVIEYNNIICNQNEWKNLKVSNYDKIEIISIVGGG